MRRDGCRNGRAGCLGGQGLRRRRTTATGRLSTPPASYDASRTTSKRCVGQRVEPQPFFAALIPGGLAAGKTLANRPGANLGLPGNPAGVSSQEPSRLETRPLWTGKKYCVGRRAPSGLACPFQAKPGIASVLQAARDYRRGKKALWLHALGPQNCQGSLARRVISHELRPQFVALRRPRNLCLPPPSQRAVSAAVAAARDSQQPRHGGEEASRQVRDRAHVR